MQQPTYQSLEEIAARKEKLQADLQQQNATISTLWHELATPQTSSSKGEFVASLVSNSITAIDGFLLVRKLIKNYGWLFSKTRRKKK
jgi:hypothetical protein